MVQDNLFFKITGKIILFSSKEY